MHPDSAAPKFISENYIFFFLAVVTRLTKAHVDINVVKGTIGLFLKKISAVRLMAATNTDQGSRNMFFEMREETPKCLSFSGSLPVPKHPPLKSFWLQMPKILIKTQIAKLVLDYFPKFMEWKC